MTHKKGPVIFIEKEEDKKCEFCDSFEETRPYGPNNKRICSKCAMKPKYKATVEYNFRKLLGAQEN